MPQVVGKDDRAREGPGAHGEAQGPCPLPERAGLVALVPVIGVLGGPAAARTALWLGGPT